ncbi:MAG: urease subunit beta [Nitrospiraceae bacterium]|nr:urease subunit beta [Nitrospiraceae bacterium]MSR23697.1 urease subunit beta [Nitrospiraceae bacterium]
MKKKAKRSPAKPKGKFSVKGRSLRSLQPADVIPGEVLLGQGDVVALEGRQTVEVTVANTGDRPVQVGSHCHFFEANRALRFDREKAFGFRLQVPAGTAVRFEPGEEKRVTLVAFGGNRIVYGINGLTDGKLDDPQVRSRALAKAAELGFMQKGSPR